MALVKNTDGDVVCLLYANLEPLSRTCAVHSRYVNENN